MDEEIKQALQKLYDSTVHLTEATDDLRQIAEAHERRLDKVEIIQEVIQERQRAHDRAMDEHDRTMAEMAARLAEARIEERQRGRDLDKRIAALVSAIGKILPPKS